MRHAAEAGFRHLRRYALAYVVLCVGLGLTGVLFLGAGRWIEEEESEIRWILLGLGAAISLLFFLFQFRETAQRAMAEGELRELEGLRNSLTGLEKVDRRTEGKSRRTGASVEAEKSGGGVAEKDRMVVALGSIAEGVITTDEEGRVTMLNRVAEELTGWREEEAVGRPLTEVFKVTGREDKPFGVVVRMERGASGSGDTTILRKDGKERLMAETASEIRGEDGRVMGTVMVFRDVTERRQTAEEMLRADKLESVGLLAGGIAHDFNNILTAIIGNLSLARMSAHSTERLLARVMEAEKAAFRAKDLTGQLLTFSKGGAPIRKPLEPGAMVKRAAQEALQGSTVECEFSLPNDLWLVDGDEGQMSQVVHNIVMNAREAMPGGGRLEISVANVELTGSQPPSLREGRYVKMSFRDNGQGIPRENLNKVFDPYFTTKEESSGMGLATAYSILRKHDGQVMVESVEGQGATFLVYLPASTRPVPVARPMMEQIRFLGRGRILVMDDEEDILSLTQVGLEMLGYEVTPAREGAEAIDHYVKARAEGKPFDAVIMDLTVPNGLGGVETIRRLKTLDPSIKAIVSSGYSYDPVMGNHREYGFSGVVPKPYRIDELGRALEELLRGGEG